MGRRPLHAGDDVRHGAVAVVVQHLADQQVGLGRDAAAGHAGGGASAADDRGYVCAVAEVVVGVSTAGEVLGLSEPADEVGVTGIDTGVQRGHLDALAMLARTRRSCGA